MRKSIAMLLATVGLILAATHAQAETPMKGGSDLLSKDRFQVRVRAVNVAPHESSTVNIGGQVSATNFVTPEVDLTYFLTDHIAAELIAATSKHEFTHSGGSPLGEAWALPPTLTMQYHFTPDKQFSPYVGAGLNYTIFYGEDTASGFTDLDVGNNLGYAVQAGFDWWVNDRWGVNLDVKKIFVNVDATLNGGAIEADIDVDPWVMGAGVAYRF